MKLSRESRAFWLLVSVVLLVEWGIIIGGVWLTRH